uniref:Ig-like domain-containing protein n=1 Tax=Maylandia zebra TaxID=106582 RepID=A0A3P9DPP7_9CICH
MIVSLQFKDVISFALHRVDSETNGIIINTLFHIYYFPLLIIHSLTCIYTAHSKPDGTPGIHKFTAMGLLDGRRIDYYDSESERKVPKQEWMRECLSAEYWGKGTQEQWLESLMNRMRQNDSVVHVLQGMRGCEGKMQPDGTLKFHRAMHTYAYDGHNLLSFDSKTKSWIAAIREAQLTMREWDSDQAMKERIKGYLENVYVQLSFSYLVHIIFLSPAPPVVYVFAKKAKVETNLILTCLATGFYTKDIIVRIKRNGRVLAKDDGLMSSGGLPNGDDTFQRRDHVEILKSDLSTFICNVTHEATNISVKKLWGKELCCFSFVISAVLLFLYKVVIPGTYNILIHILAVLDTVH